MWASRAVCGLLFHNLVRLSDKAVSRTFLLPLNVVSKFACLWAGPFLFVVHYTYRNYILVYEIDDHRIYILAVMHGRQQWPDQFDG